MREINLEILKFLVEGKAYSDSAIMQNFGIDEPELKIVYEDLAKEGYLEKYSEYEKRNKKEASSNGCGGGCGGGCSSQSSDDHKEKHSCCSNSDDWDYDNIWVLTEKALKNI
ncbi:MAG: hypothetical protein ACRCTS_00690 [Fusobacteriaceae bacterium]